MKNVFPILFCIFQFAAFAQPSWPVQQPVPNRNITTGAERTEQYISQLAGKNIVVVANPTSLVKKVHLVDTLLSLGINIKKVFAPEHGFRGDVQAGETVKDGKDTKTGLPVISLYGKNKKPGAESLEGIDIIIFDIQDVGARFYTYIS